MRSQLLSVILLMMDLSSLGLTDSVHNFTSEGNESVLRRGYLGAPTLSVFCWSGHSPSLGKFWSSVTLTIHAADDDTDYKVYHGVDAEDVQFQASRDSVFWFMTAPRLIVPDTLQISPFISSCVGVISDSDYVLSCSYDHCDPLSLFLTILGIIIFINTDSSLSPWTQFIVKIPTHLFLSSYFITSDLCRRMNLSRISTFILKCSSILMMTVTWMQLYYQEGVFSGGIILILIILAMISMISTQSISPTQLSQFVRISGLVIIFMSSYNRTASASLVLLLIIARASPSNDRRTTKLKSQDHKSMTDVALEDLRAHCQNSNLNVWNIVSKLKEPKLFADFINNDSGHVPEDQILSHQSWSEQDWRHSVVTGHRFNCILCSTDQILGHRFRCNQCFLDP